jgi:uncharacterized protein YggT (Ycf19 family)
MNRESTLILVVCVVEAALALYGFAILVRILLSWLPLRSGTLVHSRYRVICHVTEPYLRIFRRHLPFARLGEATVDLSPLAGLAVLIIVGTLCVLL